MAETTKDDVTYIPVDDFQGQALASICEHAALSKAMVDVELKHTVYGFELTHVAIVDQEAKA